MIQTNHSRNVKKTVIFITIFCCLLLLFYLISSMGYRDILEDTALLKLKVESLGNLGPALIIFGIAIAIVMSPIPSAPIALVSGALYGHTWGTIYVIIGSTTGAIIAFLIARLLGYDVLQSWFKGSFSKKIVGSQNFLMSVVFFSRLLPFISFDFISYAAGLTALSFWRFIVATIAGIIPASFLLAHFGGELSSADSRRVGLTVLFLGLFTAIPLIYRYLKKQANRAK